MSEAVDARLATLAARFRERAMADWAALSEIAADLDRGKAAGHGQSVQQIAHRLAGAGGTFGYPGISAMAAELEELVATCSNGKGLTEGCRSLIREIERGLKGR